MHSLIYFCHRVYLDFSMIIIILDEYRSIVDGYTLNRATSFLPRVLFVVKLENYDKLDHFINIYSDVPLLCHSLYIVRTARGIDLQSHCPNADPKLIFSRNIYIVWSVNDQERGVGKTRPERSARQVKQGTFACSEVIFD